MGMSVSLPGETRVVEDLGRRWTAATGDEIIMSGATKASLVTDEGTRQRWRFKRSDKMDKNLASVPEICGRGSSVVFTKKGGAIVKDDGRLAEEMIAKAGGGTRVTRSNGGLHGRFMVKREQVEPWAERSKRSP